MAARWSSAARGGGFLHDTDSRARFLDRDDREPALRDRHRCGLDRDDAVPRADAAALALVFRGATKRGTGTQAGALPTPAPVDSRRDRPGQTAFRVCQRGALVADGPGGHARLAGAVVRYFRAGRRMADVG